MVARVAAAAACLSTAAPAESADLREIAVEQAGAVDHAAAGLEEIAAVRAHPADVKFATLARYHYHDDVLTFSLYALDERWVIDSGLFSYDYENPNCEYVVSRQPHNVVTVDEPRTGATSGILTPSVLRRAVLARCLGFIQAEYQPEPGVRHRREILLIRYGSRARSAGCAGRTLAPLQAIVSH